MLFSLLIGTGKLAERGGGCTFIVCVQPLVRTPFVKPTNLSPAQTQTSFQKYKFLLFTHNHLNIFKRDSLTKYWKIENIFLNIRFSYDLNCTVFLMKRKVRSLPQVVLLYVQKFSWKPGFKPARLRPLPGMFYALPSMCQPRKSLETIPFKIIRKLTLICFNINELQFTAGALSQIVIFHQFS